MKNKIYKIKKFIGYEIKDKSLSSKKQKAILSAGFVFLLMGIVIMTISPSRANNIDVDAYKSLISVNLISESEFQNRLKENINKTTDSYLMEYSEYYSLDGEKVVEFARSITNDYEISFNDVNGNIKTDSKEGQAMLFVYYLSKDRLASPLKNYDLSVNYFSVSNSRVTMGRDQVLRSGLTFSQFLGRVCDNLNMDKNYLLAISYLETGMNTSSLALNKNNFGGLRGSGEYFSYPSPEVGIIAFILNLKGYEKYELSSIYELSGIYTHGNKYNPSYTWVSSVQKYYDKIISDPSNYFLVEDI